MEIFAGGKTIAFFNFDDIPAKDINREPSIIVKSRGFIEFDYYDKPFSHKNEMWSYHSKNKNINIKFVYYFLKQFDLSKYSSGAGVPTLNRNNVHSEMVWFPKSVKEQQAIVQKFDALSAETKKLEAVYRKKIEDLEELKKSLLQKAFSGEI